MTRETQAFGDLYRIADDKALWYRITNTESCPMRLQYTSPSKLCALWRSFLSEHGNEEQEVRDGLVQAFVNWLEEEV